MNNDFQKILENNSLIRSVVENGNFSNVDFKNYDFRELWDNHYQFKKITLDGWRFNSLEITIRNGNTWICLVTDDQKFIESLPSFFGKGITIDKEPYTNGNIEIRETRTKVGKINIYGKTARLSYLLSPLYGCAIKVSFINPSIY